MINAVAFKVQIADHVLVEDPVELVNVFDLVILHTEIAQIGKIFNSNEIFEEVVRDIERWIVFPSLYFEDAGERLITII